MADLVSPETAQQEWQEWQEWDAGETSRKLEASVERMRRSPGNVRFSDLSKVCEARFGAPDGTATSHRVFRTP